ncbi:MAG: nicotinate-nucleotide adenylyltransferase [Acetatifactor sp.]|nr:nicotinate-nucleotide adenylyltransferase [Acetatifactor sp.]
MRKIGILGGTFNPIHTGHLLLAEWAMEALLLEEVWLIPTGISYRKSQTNVLPGDERLYMTRLAAGENDRLRCLDLEVRREGYTYTWETLEQLQAANPDVRFFFILGADCLFSIEHWKNPEKIFQCCALAAAVRNDVPKEEMEQKRHELLAKFGGEIILLPFLHFSVSSSEIRRRVSEGNSIRYMVPESVRKYIEEKGFYREQYRESEKTEKKDGEGTGSEAV